MHVIRCIGKLPDALPFHSIASAAHGFARVGRRKWISGGQVSAGLPDRPKGEHHCSQRRGFAEFLRLTPENAGASQRPRNSSKDGDVFYAEAHRHEKPAQQQPAKQLRFTPTEKTEERGELVSG